LKQNSRSKFRYYLISLLKRVEAENVLQLSNYLQLQLPDCFALTNEVIVRRSNGQVW